MPSRSSLSITNTEKDELKKANSELKISLIKNEDNHHWKEAFENSAVENSKLQKELNQLKESKFQYESKNLDLLHEKKKNRALEKQILVKNAEIAKLKGQIMYKKNINTETGLHNSVSKMSENTLNSQDSKNLKLAHEATIKKSKELLKSNKFLRTEVKRLTGELEKYHSQTNSEVETLNTGRSLEGTTDRNFSNQNHKISESDQLTTGRSNIGDTQLSINDLYAKYNDLENKFLEGYKSNQLSDFTSEPSQASTASSVRRVVKPLIQNTTKIQTTYDHDSILNYTPPTPVPYSKTSYHQNKPVLPHDISTSESTAQILNQKITPRSHQNQTLQIENLNIPKLQLTDRLDLEPNQMDNYSNIDDTVVSKTSLEFTKKLEELAKERGEHATLVPANSESSSLVRL